MIRRDLRGVARIVAWSVSGLFVAGLLSVGLLLLWLFLPELTHRPPKLARAARQGDVARLEKLLAAGTDVNARGWLHYERLRVSGATALHLAAIHGQLGSAEVLLAATADVNAQTETGLTPLYMAARGRNEDGRQAQAALARALLAAGATVDIA